MLRGEFSEICAGEAFVVGSGCINGGGFIDFESASSNGLDRLADDCGLNGCGWIGSSAVWNQSFDGSKGCVGDLQFAGQGRYLVGQIQCIKSSGIKPSLEGIKPGLEIRQFNGSIDRDSLNGCG